MTRMILNENWRDNWRWKYKRKGKFLHTTTVMQKWNKEKSFKEIHCRRIPMEWHFFLRWNKFFLDSFFKYFQKKKNIVLLMMLPRDLSFMAGCSSKLYFISVLLITFLMTLCFLILRYFFFCWKTSCVCCFVQIEGDINFLLWGGWLESS